MTINKIILQLSIFLNITFAIVANENIEGLWPENQSIQINDEDLNCLFHYKFKNGHVFYLSDELEGFIYHPTHRVLAKIRFGTHISEEERDERTFHSFKFDINKNKFYLEYIYRDRTVKKADKSNNNNYRYAHKKDIKKINYTLKFFKSKFTYDFKYHALEIAPLSSITYWIYDHYEIPKENIKEYRKKYRKKKSALFFHYVNGKKREKVLRIEPLNDVQSLIQKFLSIKKLPYISKVKITNQRGFKNFSINNKNSKLTYLSYGFKTGGLGYHSFTVGHNNTSGSKGVKNISINNNNYRMIKKGVTLNLKGVVNIK